MSLPLVFLITFEAVESPESVLSRVTPTVLHRRRGAYGHTITIDEKIKLNQAPENLLDNHKFSFICYMYFSFNIEVNIHLCEFLFKSWNL